jgi:hypothetical protein
MPGKIPGAQTDQDRMKAALLETEDGLSRLVSLCHLGGLAADGMHGLGRNPDATALAFYFMMLRAELEKLRAACRAVR